jgi:hypothetical protein
VSMPPWILVFGRSCPSAEAQTFLADRLTQHIGVNGGSATQFLVLYLSDPSG